MITTIIVTREFVERYQALPISIQRKIEKQEKLFRDNLLHPSLRIEKLQPKHRAYWSLRVDKSYRILFRFVKPDEVIFMTVGTHDWVYRSWL